MVAEVEPYLRRMVQIHGAGGATSATSNGGAVRNLLHEIGKSLKPKVVCNGQIRTQGAGRPDFGRYSENQCAARAPEASQRLIPEREVVEGKAIARVRRGPDRTVTVGAA